MKKSLFLVLLAAAALISIPWSKAAEFSINCDDNGCDNSGQKFFDNTAVAPGESVTRSLEIQNNAKDQINVNVKAVKKDGTDEDFLQYVSLEIHDVGGPSRFNGSVSDFFNQTIDLGAVPAGQPKAIDFTMTLADVPNEYQGKKINFDFPVNLSVPGGPSSPSATDGVGGAGGGGVGASPSPSPKLSLTSFFGGQIAGLQTGPEESPEPSVSPSPSASPDILGQTSPRNWYWWLLLLIPLYWLIKRIRRKNASTSL
jgi:hypothetical protein